jgi:hypothetical protein
VTRPGGKATGAAWNVRPRKPTGSRRAKPASEGSGPDPASEGSGPDPASEGSGPDPASEGPG